MIFLKYHYNRWAFYHTFFNTFSLNHRSSGHRVDGAAAGQTCHQQLLLRLRCWCRWRCWCRGNNCWAWLHLNQHGNSWNGECISHVSAMYHWEHLRSKVWEFSSILSLQNCSFKKSSCKRMREEQCPQPKCKVVCAKAHRSDKLRRSFVYIFRPFAWSAAMSKSNVVSKTSY